MFNNTYYPLSEPNMNISLSFALVVVNRDPLGVGYRALYGRGLGSIYLAVSVS